VECGLPARSIGPFLPVSGQKAAIFRWMLGALRGKVGSHCFGFISRFFSWVWMRRFFLPFLFLFFLALPAGANDSITLGILAFDAEPPGVKGPSPVDEGVLGGRLGVADNNTTGRFTKQSFTLLEVKIARDGDPTLAVRQLQAQGASFIVSLLDATTLLRAADGGAFFLNAAAADERLRNEDCRPNILHILPDRAMLVDALAQYLMKKRWNKWLLATGKGAGDAAFTQAIRRASRRFGAQIVSERVWTFDRDSKPESEVPVFTQGGEYDVVIVADEANAFGDLLPYRLWLPRPVVGTQGLVAKGWDASAEDWGASQLQERFLRLAKRSMTSIDYAAWLSVRAIGEAATRAKSADPQLLMSTLLAPEFSVAGFKGRQLSFRDWDRQLRQPVFLAAANGVIALSPQDGFMHPLTELDTLGTDRPDSTCRKAAKP